MKNLILKIQLVLLIFVLAACVPSSENDFSQYELASVEEGVETEVPRTCEQIDYRDECEEREDCQPVFEEYGDRFIGCTEKPEKPEVEKPEEPEVEKPEVEKPEEPEVEKPEVEKPEEPEVEKPEVEKPEKPEVEKPEVEKPEKPEIGKPEKPEVVGPEISEICQRGNSDAGKHIMICHVPPGNAANAHTICIARQGWEHGHKGRHMGKGAGESEDYLGPCLAQPAGEEED